MLKAVLFGAAFIVAGAILFALLAPLLFPGSDMTTVGAVAFPILVVVCGVAGFAFGLARSKKS
jgi:hypothetical protein